ncbi:histone deacetylase 6 [Tupanvirus soda lake]|uniref:histone deacetylase n=2 Tax=Tupanvirus TaxID=2094720 RepID=A0A6N1NHY8_9VIRU|nr:histone deacetylase 6 [Tupanvirus soda lake]QKU34704.1 histone deacetylase 6 [Tupanvirus soda lake]
MTAIVYDERMCLHEEANHPEQPERIRSIFNAINDSGRLNKCKLIPIRNATHNEILSVHTANHLSNMKSIPGLDDMSLLSFEKMYNSVYLNKHSYDCALLSAGGVIVLCEEIVSDNSTNGIAIVRPPGHHAESNEAMGFCLFNNVAIAAKTMIKKHGLQRIVILDWDVHHGNATQHMFEDDPRVLYISIHRYDKGLFYPGGKDADPNMIGKGNGIGKNVNIGWNTGGYFSMGDTEYIYAYENLIKPMIEEYNPQLIIVSAGFDCAQGDPLGGMNVTPSGFNYLTSQLMNFANGKIVIALEGGYNIDSISVSMLACLMALLKEAPLPLKLGNVSEVAINAVNTTKNAHKSHWGFLQKN